MKVKDLAEEIVDVVMSIYHCMIDDCFTWDCQYSPKAKPNEYENYISTCVFVKASSRARCHF